MMAMLSAPLTITRGAARVGVSSSGSAPPTNGDRHIAADTLIV